MYSTIIVAAGKGSRAELTFNKIFYKIKGKPLIDFTIQPFLNDEECDRIILVISKEDLKEMESLHFPEKVLLVFGGQSRQESVYLGLQKCHSNLVFIHDGARPNLHPLLLEKCKITMKTKNALTLAIPVKDTLKTIEDDLLRDTIDRSHTVQLQTPQIFYTKEILEAHQKALDNNHSYTDDATLYYEELHQDVFIINGDELNIKATTKLDLMILEAILCTK